MAADEMLSFLFSAATRFMKRSIPSDVTLAILVFVFFVVMTLLNVIGQWDHMSSGKDEMIRLRQELFLNANQEEKITLLNKDFYEELTQAYSTKYSNKEEFCTIVNKIITDHNNRVAQMLNADQRKKWQSLIACP
jgi:hypothetical protein